MKLPVVNRLCGECTACCTAVSVDELNKGQNVRCGHLSTTIGCAIYEDRPSSCRKYQCLWLQGDLPDKYRPDKSGVVFSWGDGPGGRSALVANLMSDDIPWERAEYLSAKIFARYQRALLVIQTCESWRQLGTTVSEQRLGSNSIKQLKPMVYLTYAEKTGQTGEKG